MSGRIYLIHGQHGSGTSILGQKLLTFLKGSRRNWRKDVFHLDEDFPSDKTKAICDFITSNGCDIILTTVIPEREFLTEWKTTHIGEIIEIYLVADNQHNRTDKHLFSKYELPEVDFIQLDTSDNDVRWTFSKLINNLTSIKKD